jgi:ABC-2 type transport system ATP-binding protein
MGETLAQLDLATVRYASSVALGPVSLAVERGDFLGVLGPNGAGKTTLLKALAGLVRLAEGHLTLFGQEFPSDSTPIRTAARKSIGDRKSTRLNSSHDV